MPTNPRHCGNALQELHGPLPLGSEAVHCRSTTAYCPQIVRQCTSGAPLPNASRHEAVRSRSSTAPCPKTGALWCGVVWCAEGAVTRRQWPGCLATGTGKREDCVSGARAFCVSVGLSAERGGFAEPWMSPTRRMLSSQKLPSYSLSLRLLVWYLLQHPRHRAAWAQAAFQQRGWRLGVGVADLAPTGSSPS